MSDDELDDPDLLHREQTVSSCAGAAPWGHAAYFQVATPSPVASRSRSDATIASLWSQLLSTISRVLIPSFVRMVRSTARQKSAFLRVVTLMIESYGPWTSMKREFVCALSPKTVKVPGPRAIRLACFQLCLARMNTAKTLSTGSSWGRRTIKRGNTSRPDFVRPCT